MFCIFFQGQLKATKLLAQAKLMAKASKMKLKTSTSEESVPWKKANSSYAPMAVICELCHVKSGEDQS